MAEGITVESKLLRRLQDTGVYSFKEDHLMSVKVKAHV